LTSSSPKRYNEPVVNLEQRKFLADKLGNLGNFAVIALVFGQALSEKLLRTDVFLIGILLWIILIALGYLLTRGGE
jgi:hypothetical protein